VHKPTALCLLTLVLALPLHLHAASQPQYQARHPPRVSSTLHLSQLRHTRCETPAIAGGRKTLQRWHQQWDGTAASLKRKVGSGKVKRAL
jgi:hypothetical protein